MKSPIADTACEPLSQFSPSQKQSQLWCVVYPSRSCFYIFASYTHIYIHTEKYMYTEREYCLISFVNILHEHIILHLLFFFPHSPLFISICIRIHKDEQLGSFQLLAMMSSGVMDIFVHFPLYMLSSRCKFKVAYVKVAMLISTPSHSLCFCPSTLV